MSDSSSEEETTNAFDEIREYFDKDLWETFSAVEKKAFLNKRNRYLACIENGVPIQIPPFMQKKSGNDLNKENRECIEASQSKPSRLQKRKLIKTSVPVPRQSERQQPKRQKLCNSNTNAQDQPVNVNTQEQLVEEEEAFPEIKPFYTPTKWSSMSIIVKRHLQTSKDEYEAAVKEGLNPPIPKFMQRNDAGTSTSTKQVASSSDGGREMQISPFNEQGVADDSEFVDNVPDNQEEPDPSLAHVFIDAEIRNVIFACLPKARKDVLEQLSKDLAKEVDDLSELHLVTKEILDGYELGPIQKEKLLQLFKKLKKIPRVQSRETACLPLPQVLLLQGRSCVL